MGFPQVIESNFQRDNKSSEVETRIFEQYDAIFSICARARGSSVQVRTEMQNVEKAERDAWTQTWLGHLLSSDTQRSASCFVHLQMRSEPRACPSLTRWYPKIVDPWSQHFEVMNSVDECKGNPS